MSKVWRPTRCITGHFEHDVCINPNDSVKALKDWWLVTQTAAVNLLSRQIHQYNIDAHIQYNGNISYVSYCYGRPTETQLMCLAH